MYEIVFQNFVQLLRIYDCDVEWATTATTTTAATTATVLAVAAMNNNTYISVFKMKGFKWLMLTLPKSWNEITKKSHSISMSTKCILIHMAVWYLIKSKDLDYLCMIFIIIIISFILVEYDQRKDLQCHRR